MERPVFKPSKPRASLGSFPAQTKGSPGKENHTSTSNNKSAKRKRAQSLGGDALELAEKRAKEMNAPSPVKLNKRSQMPRRSILKPSNLLDNDTQDLTSIHTTDLSHLSVHPFKRRTSLRGAQASAELKLDDERNSESEDEEMDMDLTNMTQDKDLTDRRKSLMSRRVSFAPNAHIRTFTPDKPTAQAQALAQAMIVAQQQFLNQNTTLDDGPFSPLSSDSSDSGSPEPSETSMEMAGDEITTAFAGHFAGTVIPADAFNDIYDDGEKEQQQHENSRDEGDDSRSSEAMDEVADDITSAFASQPIAVHNALVSVTNVHTRINASISSEAGKTRPRFSEVVRREDAEDEEILRQLGLARGGLPNQTAAMKTSTNKSAVSFGGDVISDEEDENEFDEDASTEDDRTDLMDMTTAVGGVVSITQSSGVIADPVEDEEDTMSGPEMAEQTQTMDMQEATTYGGILSQGVPTPSTPSARLQAEIFKRQSLAGVAVEDLPKLNSPRRAPVLVGHQGTPNYKSPGRISSTPSKAPLSASAKASNATPTRPGSISTTPTRTKSPRKVNTPKSALKNRSPFTPRVLTPQAQNGRSPGGSLSLLGLRQEQLARESTKLATTSVQRSPAARKSPRVIQNAATVAPMFGDEDITGSSFRSEVDEAPALINSLNEFFEATGTGFMKNILSMTGVDVHKKRKSMMPARSTRASISPPAFADLAVAGGCKSLFHQLYQAEQARLQEEIQGAMGALSQYDDALQFEQPKVFQEWTAASQAQRVAMQSQFRMIKAHYYLVGKIEWNEYRRENYQSIIQVMEENLQGLRADNAIVEQVLFKDVLPSLQERHAILRQELMEERTRDHELSGCDPNQLAELHSAIEEQGLQLEIQDRQYAEVAAQLTGLQTTADKLAQIEERMTAEKDELHRKLEEGRCFTKNEVFRLQAEYNALKHIHGWDLVHFSPGLVRLQHLGQFEVSLGLRGAGVISSSFTILPDTSSSTLSIEITKFFFHKMEANVHKIIESEAQEGQMRHPKAVLHYIASIWTNARRLRKEIALVHLRYPTKARLVGGSTVSSVLHMTTEIYVHKARAMLRVEFDLTGEEIVSEEERRPVELQNVVTQIGCDVYSKVGKLDGESIKYIVREKLDAGGRGALLEACREAEAL